MPKQVLVVLITTCICMIMMASFIVSRGGQIVINKIKSEQCCHCCCHKE